MTDATPRFALPLIEPGQAQKELFHNEAITALDLLVQGVAETLGDDAPPAAPAAGQSWIVGTAPTGDWLGQAGAVASWTEGGWRFTAPVEGMRLWVRGLGLCAQRIGGDWLAGREAVATLVIGGVQVVGGQRPAIADPAGGAAIDAEARAVLGAVLDALRTHGLVAR